MEDTKKIEYRCKFCKFEWFLEYPVQATVNTSEVKCPNCKKMGGHKRPYNFFKSHEKSSV